MKKIAGSIVLALFLTGCASTKQAKRILELERQNADLKHDLSLCLQERKALVDVFKKAGVRAAQSAAKDK